VAVLTKPFDVHDVLAAVERAVCAAAGDEPSFTRLGAHRLAGLTIGPCTLS
jgi:hypothetical protein